MMPQYGKTIQRAQKKASKIVQTAIESCIVETVNTMLRLRCDMKEPNDEWHNIQYLQAIRDALEAMKQCGLIEGYDLSKTGRE